MTKHWSERTSEDILGSFKIFVISAIVIYVALSIAKTLYPTFPITNTSSGVVSVILAIFLTLLNYIKSKNRY